MPAVSILAAYLATPRPPARDWPTPDGPDGERWDDQGDDWPAAMDYELPIGWPR